MVEQKEIQAARDAIGRLLAVGVAVERSVPEPLKVLLRELKRQDEQSAERERGNR